MRNDIWLRIPHSRSSERESSVDERRRVRRTITEVGVAEPRLISVGPIGRYIYDSTSIRRQFNRATPFDDLRYDGVCV